MNEGESTAKAISQDRYFLQGGEIEAIVWDGSLNSGVELMSWLTERGYSGTFSVGPMRLEVAVEPSRNQEVFPDWVVVRDANGTLLVFSPRAFGLLVSRRRPSE
jgi:hypothetical protein